MIDIDNGILRLSDGSVLSPDTMPAASAAAGFKEFGESNGFRYLGSSLQHLWGKKFSIILRFKAEKLSFISLTWNEGPTQRLGYDATETLLLGEKKQLSKMLTKHLGTAPADTSLRVDYFLYSWGLVSVRADLRSVLCSVEIDYSARPG